MTDPHRVTAHRIGRAAAQMQMDADAALKAQGRAARSREQWALLVAEVNDRGMVPETTLAHWSGMSPKAIRRALGRAYRQRVSLAAATGNSPSKAWRRPIVRVWHASDTAAAAPGTP